MNKPKALIVASVASMIQQFNMPNIKLLIDMGYDVDVACNFVDSGTIPSSKSKELMENLDKLNVKYYQVDFDRNAFNFFKNMKAYKQMKKIMLNRYTLVHSHSPIGGVIARLTANKYRKKGLKSIYTAHGFHFYRGASIKMWIIFYPIEKILSRITDVLITINKDDYKLAKDKMKAEKIIYIPGVGIDSQRLFEEARLIDVKKIKEGLNIGNRKVLLSVGEINKNKNHQSVVDALSKVNNRDYIYIIIGQGSEKEELRQLIRKNNLENNIKLLGYKDNVSSYYAIADLFIFPSKREGLSVALMEAMTFGLPVICSNIRGNLDLITEEGGYLFSLEKKHDLQNALEIFLEMPELAEKKGKHNFEVSRRYSVKNIMKLMESVYTYE